MKSKIFVFLIIAAFLLSAFALAFSERASAQTANNLARLLPASDIVITLDAKKAFNTALPQVLSANPDKLAEINARIDEIKTKTGLDARRFEQVAVGANARQISSERTEIEPFILARGSFDSAEMINAAKTFSKGKYTEERIGGRTVYVFKLGEIVPQKAPAAGGSLFDKMLEKIINSISNELAVAAFDNNTLALGTAGRLREAFKNEKSRVSADTLGLAAKNPNAVLAFAGKAPRGMGALLPLENDEIGELLDSINQFSGSLDVGESKADLSIWAKTVKTEDAEALEGMLGVIRTIGGTALKGNKNPDKQVYARMLENVNISRSGAEITLALEVPQSDLDIIVGKR
jgi:hypothetical protein